MPKVSVLDMSGKAVGEIELMDSVFGIEISESALHQAVKAHLANRRQGTQSTLTRAEVRGGGRKPWRQKGTGRARQGSTRSPQWTHGGIAFGPKPRSYRITLNKKLKRLAMKSALTAKAQSGEIIVLEGVTLEEIKTKKVVEMLKAIGAQGKALIVTPDVERNLVLSARNIPGIATAPVGSLNVYDILNHTSFVVLKDAVHKIEEVYAQ